MKRKIIIFILFLLTMYLLSCNNTTEEIIDGCEYIKQEDYSGNGTFIYSRTHKGNCSNPIHKNNIIDSLSKEILKLKNNGK